MSGKDATIVSVSGKHKDGGLRACPSFVSNWVVANRPRKGTENCVDRQVLVAIRRNVHGFIRVRPPSLNLN